MHLRRKGTICRLAGKAQDSYPSPGAAAARHHTTAAANSAVDSLRLCRSEGWWAQLGHLLKLRGHQRGFYGGSGKKAPPACAGCAQDPGPCWPWSEGVPSTSGSGLCLHLQSQQKRWGLSHTWSLLVSPSCLWRCPRSSLLLKVHVTIGAHLEIQNILRTSVFMALVPSADSLCPGVEGPVCTGSSPRGWVACLPRTPGSCRWNEAHLSVRGRVQAAVRC